jgi:hypothetical protein
VERRAPATAQLPAHKRAHWRTSLRIGIAFAVVIALAVVFTAWRGGTFDRALVNVGLNAKECARNDFGATFCGRELTEYRARQRHASQEAAKGKQEAEAARKKEREEGKADQHKREEESAPLLGPIETEAERLYRQGEELWRHVE